MDLTPADRRLLAALEDGLALEARPYARLAETAGMSEAAVIARLAALAEGGVISRFGVIVRHRALGYGANAMTVWDVPDGRVAAAGRRIAAMADVTLCYRRPRRPPVWPYNLFCMVHSRDRAAVEARIDVISQDAGLDGLPRAVLFSTRCFKQRGARYAMPADAAPQLAETGT